MLYGKRPEPFHARIDDLVNGLISGDTAYTTSLAPLFWIIVKEHSEIVTSTQVDRLFASIKDRSAASLELRFIFQALGFVANAQPNLFHNHRALLLRFVVEEQDVSAFNCLQQYLVAWAIAGEQQIANECFTILIDLLKDGNRITNDLRAQVFYTCQMIGMINKQALEAKRVDLVAFGSHAGCRILLDLIDGNKMSEESQAAINQTRKEITQMQKRMVKTERDVHDVTKSVQGQELNVSFVLILHSAKIYHSVGKVLVTLFFLWI